MRYELKNFITIGVLLHKISNLYLAEEVRVRIFLQFPLLGSCLEIGPWSPTINEAYVLRHEKTNNVVSEQLRHKLCSTRTEEG